MEIKNKPWYRYRPKWFSKFLRNMPKPISYLLGTIMGKLILSMILIVITAIVGVTFDVDVLLPIMIFFIYPFLVTLVSIGYGVKNTF